MPKRVAQFWLPAFLTLSLSMVCLALIQAFGPNPWVSPLPGGRLHMTPVAVVYLPWLLALPLIGALGSYLSLTAGGSKRVVFSAMAFPVLPYLVFFIIGFPLALILDDQVAHDIMIPAFFAGLFAWVILPGAALLTGGWPVQFCASRRLNPIDSANS